MRILLVTMYYYPEPNTKPHDLAQELVRRGHEVFVVTGFPHYPHDKLYEGYKMRLHQWEDIDGVHVLRVPIIIDRSKSAIRRIIYYLSFSISAATVSPFFIPRPDVIWTYGIGLPGLLLSVLRRTPYVHEVQDLWPDWGRAAGIGMKDWLYNMLGWQEKFVRRRATKITTISEGFRQILIRKGTPQTKISIIPNWANEEHFHPTKADPELGTREGLIDHFNVMYIGNIGTAQALNVMLKAAKLLRGLQKVQFVVIGDGVDREDLECQAHENNLSNVLFLGSRSQTEISQYAAFADVLLIHLKDDPIYKITIPSKTYAYLATGRPIIAASEGDVANLIKEIGAGIVIKSENEVELANAVRQFYYMPKQDRERFGNVGYEAFLARFTRQILVDKYEQIFSLAMEN